MSRAPNIGDPMRRARASESLAAARANGELQVRLFNAVFTLDHRSQLPWSIDVDDATAASLRADALAALFTRNVDQMTAAADAIGRALRGAP